MLERTKIAPEALSVLDLRDVRHPDFPDLEFIPHAIFTPQASIRPSG